MSRRNPILDVILGIFFILGVNILVAIAVVFLSLWLQATILFILFSAMGLVQLIYVIPIVLRLRRRQRWEFMKGVIIGAVITALLNGGCWLFFYYSF